MNDGQRVYPVEYFFLHHSTGPDFVNASDLEVQNWYSDTGKARGYSNGTVNSNHEHPSKAGQQTYAQAQFTLRKYTKDGNKYGYRITDLIKRPWQNVAWAVGDWFYNQRSSSLEICGNFLNQILPEKALMCIADFLRPIDKELGGILKVWLHQEVFATACPARIKEQRMTIVDMINNPDKWNKKLWPPTPVVPKPVITTKDVTETQPVAYKTTTKDSDILPKGERKIERAGVAGVRTIVQTITFTDGKETKRVVKSDTVTKAPIDESVLVGTYVAPPVDVPKDPSRDDQQDVQIGGIMDLLRVIGDAISSFLAKFKK